MTMLHGWFEVRCAASERRWDEVIDALTGVRSMPQDIALVLASHAAARPEFQQILLTLETVQDCVLNTLDPLREGRWNSMSILRHFASPFAEWLDAPAYAIRSSIATRRQKRALGTREAAVLEALRSGQPLSTDTVGEVWQRILREENFLNVERSQFHEWHYPDVIRRFPEKVRRGAQTPGRAGIPKEAMRILAGWGDEAQRRELAGNPDLPLDLLLTLIDDPCEDVARACAANPQCSGDLADLLEARCPDLTRSLDSHPHADIDRQLRLPAGQLCPAGLERFLAVVQATPEEAEQLRTAAGGAEERTGLLWRGIGWRAATDPLLLT